MKMRILSVAAVLFAALFALSGTAMAEEITGTVSITGPLEGIEIGEAFDITLDETITLADNTITTTGNFEEPDHVEVTAQMGEVRATVAGVLTVDDGTGEARITVSADGCRALFASAGSWTIQVSFTGILQSDDAMSEDPACRIISGAFPVDVAGGAAAPQITAESVRFCAAGGEEYMLVSVRCEDGYSFNSEADGSGRWMVRLAGTGLTLHHIACDGAGGHTAVIRLNGSAAAGSLLEIQALPAAFMASEAASGILTLVIPKRDAVPLNAAFLMEDGVPAGVTWQLKTDENMTVPEEFRILIEGSKGNRIYDAAVHRGEAALSITGKEGLYTYTCRLPGWDSGSIPADTYSIVIISGSSESFGASWIKTDDTPPEISENPAFQDAAAGRAPAGGTAEAVPNDLTTKSESGSGGQAGTAETVKNPDGSSVTTVSREDGSGSTTSITAEGQMTAVVTLSASAVSAAQDSRQIIVLPMPAVYLTAGVPAPVVIVTTGSMEPVRVEIPAEGAAPGIVAVRVHADGTEEVIRTSFATGTGVIAALSDGDVVRIVDNSAHFSDARGHWAEDAISFVTAHELFSGTGGDRFAPDGGMTRAMVVTVLARYDGVDTGGGETWYEKGVGWAMDNGISSGTDLEAAVSREQLAAMLYRYAASAGQDAGLQGDLTVFSDADSVSGYAGAAMAWAVGAGLIGGTEKGTLAPQDSATRAEVAAILMRFCAYAARQGES